MFQGITVLMKGTLKGLTLLCSTLALSALTFTAMPTESAARPTHPPKSKDKGKGKVEAGTSKTGATSAAGQASTSKPSGSKGRAKEKPAGKKPSTYKPTRAKQARNADKKSSRKQSRGRSGAGTSTAANNAGPSSRPSGSAQAGPSNRQAQVGGPSNDIMTVVANGRSAQGARFGGGSASGQDSRVEGTSAGPSPRVGNIPDSSLRSGQIAQARRQGRTSRGNTMTFRSATQVAAAASRRTSVSSDNSAASSVLTRAPMNPWSGKIEKFP